MQIRKSPSIQKCEARASLLCPPAEPGPQCCEDQDSNWGQHGAPRAQAAFFFPTLVLYCIWPRNFGCGRHHMLGMILFFSLNFLPSSWFISSGLKLDASWTSFFGMEDTSEFGGSPPYKLVASNLWFAFTSPIYHLICASASPVPSLIFNPAPFDLYSIYH